MGEGDRVGERQGHTQVSLTPHSSGDGSLAKGFSTFLAMQGSGCSNSNLPRRGITLIKTLLGRLQL